MPLFNIHIDKVIVQHDEETLSEIKELLIINNQNQLKIMGALDDVKQELAAAEQRAIELQATVDSEQTQIQTLLDFNATVKAQLEARIAELEAQLADGATPAQLTELKDKLVAIKDSLATTKADIEGTIPDQPVDPGDPTARRRRG